MSKQLHKNFTDGQVKSLLKSYLDKKIKINYILQMLRIKRSRFFELLSQYRKDPDNFSIQYNRRTINRKIDPEIDKNIVKELKIEKDLIKAKDVLIRCYNYSYIWVSTKQYTCNLFFFARIKLEIGWYKY